jgi:hypothetical protein
MSLELLFWHVMDLEIDTIFGTEGQSLAMKLSALMYVPLVP